MAFSIANTQNQNRSPKSLFWMKSFFRYILVAICLLWFSSCKKEDIEPNKFLGKWSLSAAYMTSEYGDPQIVDVINPQDEILTWSFISNDEVVVNSYEVVEEIHQSDFKYERVIDTLKYTFNESTNKLIFHDKKGSMLEEWEVRSFDLKTMKVRAKVYEYSSENNKFYLFLEYIFDRL